MSRTDLDAIKLRELADWLADQNEAGRLGAEPAPEGTEDKLRQIADYLSTHVVVGPKRYARLIEDQDKLNALEQWGVDNWSGYDDAMRELRSADDE